MKVRVITSCAIAAVGLPILFFSQYIVYPLFLSILAAIAAFEILRVIGIHKNLFVSIPAYIIAPLAPLGAYFAGYERLISAIIILSAIVFVYLIYLFFIAVFAHKTLKYSKVAEAFSSLLYVIVSFAALSAIRLLPNGVWYLGLVFAAAWGSDVCAYFSGYFFGKHKLIPEVSPKKTVEGSVGGVIGATLIYLLIGLCADITTSVTPNYIVLAISGLVLSAISQIGDLVASLIKREYGVKDYSNMLPGHGGVMDRFDSVLSIAGAQLIIFMVFPPLV